MEPRATGGETPFPAPPTRRAGGFAPLIGTYLGFGVFWGSIAVIFADFLAEHGLSPGQASIGFATLSAVAILVMTFVAPRLQSLPRSTSITLALGIHALGGLLLAFLPTSWLILGFATVGIGTGLVDVFVNVAGQQVEARSERAVLQWVHASYSAGSVLGAVFAGVALTLGAPFQLALLAAAAAQAGAALGTWASPALRALPAAQEAGPRNSLSAFVRSPFLLVPALVVLCAFFVEGSMDVWSVIYLRRTLGASVLAGAGGFAAFALATFIGRAFAARVLFGMGYRRTIVVSGVGSVASGLVAALTNEPWVASIAFLILGFCLSAAAPAAFGMPRGPEEKAGPAIAAITTVGYAGFVVGPPAMGWLADQAGLRAAIGFMLVGTVGILVGGLLSRKPPA